MHILKRRQNIDKKDRIKLSTDTEVFKSSQRQYSKIKLKTIGYVLFMGQIRSFYHIKNLIINGFYLKQHHPFSVKAYSIKTFLWYFNSHARVGRDTATDRKIEETKISTHTPV